MRQVVPAESRYELLKTKVEVRLRKAAPATWSSLEARSAAAPVATNVVDPALAHPPAYPSSSARRAAVCPWFTRCQGGGDTAPCQGQNLRRSCFCKSSGGCCHTEPLLRRSKVHGVLL